MSVDYYTCHYCGETFSDCGEYVSCECGNKWCSDECAEMDGFENLRCTRYGAIGEIDVGDIAKEHCNKDYCSGADCEFYVESSCKFCREEDYEDYELLEKALKLLGISRHGLIRKMKDN